MKRLIRLVPFVALGAVLGCSSAMKTEIVAPTAKVPISFSPGLLHERGLVAKDRIATAGAFRYEGEVCDGARLDLSGPINEQVARAGGDAVTELAVFARAGGSCADVRVAGKIVKVASPARRKRDGGAK